jgi:hypothetical protein
MSGKSQHVVPNSKGEWVVRRSGSARATRVFETRHGAVKYAKRLAQKSGAELYIHRAATWSGKGACLAARCKRAPKDGATLSVSVRRTNG